MELSLQPDTPKLGKVACFSHDVSLQVVNSISGNELQQQRGQASRGNYRAIGEKTNVRQERATRV